MTFSISSAVLLKQLQAISGVISNNTYLPILENFLFVLEDSSLTVTASDMQMVMTTRLDVDSKEKGAFAIPANLLLTTLKSLPEQPITINIDTNTFGSELVTANGRYKISGQNPTDFPKTPAVASNLSVQLPAPVLSSAIANTVFATSNDDLRPAMTGVLMNLAAGQTTFVATDGHKLVRFSRTDVQAADETSIIIPKKAFNILKNTLVGEQSTVSIDFSTSHAFFAFGSIQLICRLIDERFVDYNAAIPTENPNVLTISRTELMSALKRISNFANKTSQQVRFKLDADSLVISAEDLDYSNEANEKLLCDYDGEPLEIGFNARFFAEMLGILSCQTITLEMSAPNRAGIIVPKEKVENEDILMLVMPVMLNNYN
jgi:DNA polymerase III subunit beta